MRPRAQAAAACFSLLGLASAGRAQAGELRVAVRDAPAAIVARLRIDGRVRIVDEIAQADLVVARRFDGDVARAAAAVLFPRGPEDLAQAGLGPVGRASGDAVSVLPRDAEPRAVPWQSAPRVLGLLVVRPPAPWRPLVRTEAGPVLVERAGAGPRVLVWLAPLDRPDNRDVVLWPAFGYVLHALAFRAANRPIESFGRWAGSPVPSGSVRVIVLAVAFGLWPLSAGLFLWARRRPRATPPDAARAWGLGAERPSAPAGWSRVGFARPLGGQLVFLSAALLLVGPYIYLSVAVVPRFVQPFPQAEGLWGGVVDFLMVLFWLFDMGTGVALVKFAAADRTRDPAEALYTVQFFVWWQILSGVVQITLLALAACYVLPRSSYATFSHLVILHAAGQWPGCLFVFAYVLTAAQRYDLALVMDLLHNRILAALVPIGFVLLFRHWGRDHPAYGEAFGAAVGLGVGGYVSQWLAFGVGWSLVRRAGLRIAPFWSAHFTLAAARRVLSFGGRLVGGQVATRAAYSLEVFLLTRLLLNYTESLGVRAFLQSRFLFAYLLVYPFFDSAVAAISESMGWGKRALTQHYVARYLQWGLLWGAIVSSVLAGLGPMLVRGILDSRWWRVADLLPIAALAWTLVLPGWVSDSLQRGAGRPGLYSWLLGGEQAIRVGLMLLLVPWLQLAGVFWAIAIGLGLKLVVGYWLNHRLIVPLRLSLRRHLFAPVVAGAVSYALLRLAAALVAPSSRPAVLFFFVAGAVGAFGLTFVLNGALGGWDRAALDEIDEAARLGGWLRPIAKGYAALARAGAALCPPWLRGVPDPLAEEARGEAAAIELSAPEGAPRGG